jgi:hypothetical protein
MKNMAFKRVGTVLVAIHNGDRPDDAVWAAYIDAVLALGKVVGGDLSRAKHIVFTDGGAPNSAQRDAADAASRAFNGKALPVAIVSASPIVRGIVGIFRWLGFSRMRSFSPNEADEAFRYLGIPPGEAGDIWVAAKLLQSEIRGGEVKSLQRR